MRPRWIFFDLDDTLIADTARILYHELFPRKLAAKKGIGLEEAHSLLQSIEIDGVGYEGIPYMARTVNWYNLKVWMAELGVDDFTAELLEDLKPHLRMTRGTRRLLRKLSRSYRLGIITNQPSYIADWYVRWLGIADYFSQIMTVDRAGAPKPHRQIFLQALERAGCEPGEALYVGNSWVFDLPAKRVGMRVVLVGQKSSPSSLRPDYTIDRLDELAKILYGM